MSRQNNEKTKKVVKVGNKKKPKKILRTLIIVIAVALVTLTALYVVPQVKNEVERTDSAEGDLLFTVDSELTDGIKLSSGNIAVTGKSLISFKASGEKRYTENIGYSSPVFKSSDKKYIAFERSTGKYTIADKSEIIYQGDLEEEIINADIASNGNYAIITRSAQSTLVVTIYSSKNTTMFSWECTDDYLTDVALSKNGKSVAVSSINVSNGDPYSRIYYFNVDSLEIESKLEYPNETVYRIKFIDNKKISVITDISYMIADMKETQSQVVSYEYDELAGFSFGSKSSVAILKKEFGSLNDKNLMVIDKNCEKVFEKSIESDILDFKTDSKNVYVLISGKILVYSISSGERVDDIEVDASSSKLMISGNTAFTFSENSVYKYVIK